MICINWHAHKVCELSYHSHIFQFSDHLNRAFSLCIVKTLFLLFTTGLHFFYMLSAVYRSVAYKPVDSAPILLFSPLLEVRLWNLTLSKVSIIFLHEFMRLLTSSKVLCNAGSVVCEISSWILCCWICLQHFHGESRFRPYDLIQKFCLTVIKSLDGLQFSIRLQ